MLAAKLPAAPAAAWFSVGAMAAAVAGVVRGRSCAVALAVGAVFFAGGWYSHRIHEAGGATLEVALARGLAAEEARIVHVEGLVVSPPQRAPTGGGSLGEFTPGQARWTFELRVRRVEAGGRWADARGGLRAHVDGHEPPGVGAGERVRAKGRFEPVRRALNAGAPERRLWAAQEGEAGRLVLPSPELVRAVPHEGVLERVRARWHALAGGVRERARRALGDVGEDDGDGARLVRALVLGERDPDWRPTRDAFTRIGVAHLLAISGFHVALLGSMAAGALRLLRDPGRLEFALVALLVLLFLLIVPAKAPVVRGGAMALALVAQQLGGRRLGGLSVLAWVGVGLLLWRPLDLMSLGFQLSLGLTAALVVLWPRLERAWRPARLKGLRRTEPTGWRWLLRWWRTRVLVVFGVSVLCWLLATPIVVHHTGLVSPISVLSTLVVLPAVFVILGGGYLAVFVGVLAPPAGAFIASVASATGEATVRLVRVLDGVGVSSYHLPAVGAAWAIAATALLAAWFWRGGRWAGPRFAAAGLVALVWLGAEVRRPGVERGVELRLDTLAVGDGSCHLVRAGGDAVLWDCGSRWSGVGEREVPRAVRALGAPRVERVVLTHPDLDHFSGVLDVLGPLGVREVIIGEEFAHHAREDRRGPEALVLERLEAEGVAVTTVARGDALALGELSLRILWPPAGARFERANEASLVAQVEGEAGAIVLCGDVQAGAMAALLELEPGLRADVLELPHHGSHSPVAEAFVGRLDPRVVVQSTGPGRLGDERWERARRGRVWRTTARHGGVSVELREGGEVAVRRSR